MYVCVCVCVYICRERERERDRYRYIDIYIYRKHFAKVDGTELTALQSKEDVAAKFPSLHPSLRIMLAQNVASAVAAWALDPEEEAIISQINEAAAVAGLGVNDQFDIDKFTADKLIMGLPPRSGCG